MTREKIGRLILVSVVALVFVIGFNMVPTTQADPDLYLSISEIQGPGFETPYPYYYYVVTSGVVTADFQHEEKNGFFMQDVMEDGNPATSEGIFVYEPLYKTWTYDTIYDVEVGDKITIKARSREYYDFTELDYVQWINVESSGETLPEPVELDPPCDDLQSDIYYEALEGMLVSCSEMRAIAGTNNYDEAAGVRLHWEQKRVFQDDPCGTGNIIFTDDAGGVDVLAKSGDIIKDLIGPLDYSYEEYKVLPSVDAQPTVEEAFPWMDVSLWTWKWESCWYERMGYVTIATYNMYNLFIDYNVEDELAKHALAIHNYLREPDLIAVQEIENITVLEMLVNTEPIETDYGIVTIDGPDERGIDVGLLYNKDRIKILSAEARQTCTDLNDGYGPGTDPNYPCPEGYNPLFSRPPLVVHLKVKTKSSCWWPRYSTGYKHLWVIVNHFKSKSVYEPYYADTTPRRIEQAAWVSYLVDEIQAHKHNAKVIVIGDFNDFMDSEPLAVLEDGGLYDMMWTVNKENRYTYIYNGVSEVLDHMLITPNMRWDWRCTHVLHFNPDWPYRTYRYDTTSAHWSTDHDIIVGAFRLK